MRYQKDGIEVVLEKGYTDGYHWVIVSYGTHPCAYVGLPKGHKFYGVHYDNIPINTHGGLTFSDNELKINEPEIKVWWIGWDYSHAGDYVGYTMMISNYKSYGEEKKWTTKEIKDDIMSVITQIKRI